MIATYDMRGTLVSPRRSQVPDGAATYTVALRSQPTGPVTVTPVGGRARVRT